MEKLQEIKKRTIELEKELSKEHSLIAQQREELQAIYDKYEGKLHDCSSNIDDLNRNISNLTSQIILENDNWSIDKDAMSAVFTMFYLEEKHCDEIKSVPDYVLDTINEMFQHPLISYIEGALFIKDKNVNKHSLELETYSDIITQGIIPYPRFNIMFYQDTTKHQIESLCVLLEQFLMNIQQDYLDAYYKDFHIELIVEGMGYPYTLIITHQQDDTYRLEHKIDINTLKDNPIDKPCSGTLQDILMELYKMMYE